MPPGATPVSWAEADRPAVNDELGIPGNANDIGVVIPLWRVTVTVSPVRTTRFGPGAVAVPASPVEEKPQIGMDRPRMLVVPGMDHRSHATSVPLVVQPLGDNAPAATALPVAGSSCVVADPLTAALAAASRVGATGAVLRTGDVGETALRWAPEPAGCGAGLCAVAACADPPVPHRARVSATTPAISRPAWWVRQGLPVVRCVDERVGVVVGPQVLIADLSSSCSRRRGRCGRPSSSRRRRRRSWWPAATRGCGPRGSTRRRRCCR